MTHYQTLDLIGSFRALNLTTIEHEASATSVSFQLVSADAMNNSFEMHQGK